MSYCRVNINLEGVLPFYERRCLKAHWMRCNQIVICISLKFRPEAIQQMVFAIDELQLPNIFPINALTMHAFVPSATYLPS
jgi:hypothetical protein